MRSGTGGLLEYATQRDWSRVDIAILLTILLSNSNFGNSRLSVLCKSLGVIKLHVIVTSDFLLVSSLTLLGENWQRT